MTARDRASLSLAGAVLTGHLHDAIAALTAVLDVCEVGLVSPGPICWRVTASGGDVLLSGWFARDAHTIARGVARAAGDQAQPDRGVRRRGAADGDGGGVGV